MTSENYDELKLFIEGVYAHLGKRPEMFAGRAESIESFVFALEMVLDHFGGTTRASRYSAFKSTSQFGNEPLFACFERINQCRLCFISLGEKPVAFPSDVFKQTFDEHWTRYLEERRKDI